MLNSLFFSCLMRFFSVCFFSLICLVSTVWAVTIEFPKEELARESVLPRPDRPFAVHSRLIPTEGRFELGASVGMVTSEPFLNPYRFGGHLAYHITETHGVVFMGRYHFQGLGSNGKRFEGTDLNEDASATNFVRLSYAPQINSSFLLNYQMVPFYGKISLLKNTVMNLSIHLTLGAGVVHFEEEDRAAFRMGVGQNFYFSKFWGLRLDLGLLTYSGLDYFHSRQGGSSPLQDQGNTINVQVPLSEFGSRQIYDLNVFVGCILLI